VGYLAEEAIRLAILDAVSSAESMGGRPAFSDRVKKLSEK
jgi:L-aminopeptidase/D-esterase-like protein